MMLERFTGSARQILVRAQQHARRLGHNYLGCEHLLLALAESDEPAGAALRDQGVTPERVEEQILRMIGRGSADPLQGLDREALAAIGIDLDVVRARLEAAFGPGALDRAVQTHRYGAHPARRRGRPEWGKGPVAHLMHVRRQRRARRAAFAGGPVPLTISQQPSAPVSRGHIPFTPRAKKSLQLALREALALHDDYIGVQHLVLAQLRMKDGMAQTILSVLGASNESLRAAVLARYRKAS
jgi:ATP-dependent Clp protease ATP-binding subunit ClpA